MYKRISSFSYRLLLMALLAVASLSSSAADDFATRLNRQAYGDGQHVIYELNVGSFTAEGTFQAASKQLGTLRDLGVDIVWLMPVYPRGGGLNSPYAAVDFMKTNPNYGTVADLKALVADAHALNMQVWLDWVPNHMATNATWVTTHPSFFTTDSDGQMIHPNNYGDVYQLNYSNQELVDSINRCLKYWIDETDIDGYRCDYVSSPGIPVSYWQNTIPMLKNYRQGKTITIMGEADFSDQTRLQSVGFDYDYAWGFQTKLVKYGAGGMYIAPLKVACNKMIAGANGYSRMLYLTNHDQNYNETAHTLTQKYGDNRYLLTVLYYTIYGMPLIYNGQEIGGNQTLNYFQDTKIDWTQQDKQMTNTLRVLSALKHTQAALHDGKNSTDNAQPEWLTSSTSANNILAYRRTCGSSEVIVVLNTGTSSAKANISGISGTYQVWLNSASIASAVGRSTVNFDGTLTASVPAKGYLVYVKGEAVNDSVDTADVDPAISALADTNKVSVYYESDLSDAAVCGWVWSESDEANYSGEYYSEKGAWPGDPFVKVGETTSGRTIYQLPITIKDGLPLPTNIIITENGSDDANKVITAVFVNHGYYVKGETTQPVLTIPTSTTGINTICVKTGNGACYNLSGLRVDRSYHGIVIQSGRKYIRH